MFFFFNCASSIFWNDFYLLVVFYQFCINYRLRMSQMALTLISLTLTLPLGAPLITEGRRGSLRKEEEACLSSVIPAPPGRLSALITGLAWQMKPWRQPSFELDILPVSWDRNGGGLCYEKQVRGEVVAKSFISSLFSSGNQILTLRILRNVLYRDEWNYKSLDSEF